MRARAKAAPAFVLRHSEDGDIAAIAAIYAHHVRFGLGSFEEEPPAPDEVRRRRAEVLARRLPYLVAADAQGTLLGYAYASPYRTRSAYRHTLENSVYVREGLGGHGVGSELLGALIERCARGRWRQMIAVIGDSANAASIALHRKHGFRQVGTLEAVGFKFGRWVDSVLMQRALGEGDASPPKT